MDTLLVYQRSIRIQTSPRIDGLSPIVIIGLDREILKTYLDQGRSDQLVSFFFFAFQTHLEKSGEFLGFCWVSLIFVQCHWKWFITSFYTGCGRKYVVAICFQPSNIEKQIQILEP